MARYAIPCIISLLVGALYNIVDQIFIANAALWKCGEHGVLYSMPMSDVLTFVIGVILIGRTYTDFILRYVNGRQKQTKVAGIPTKL